MLYAATQFAQAYKLQTAGRLDEAAALYDALLRADPRHARAMIQRATIELAEGGRSFGRRVVQS